MCFQIIQYQLKNNREIIILKEIILKEIILKKIILKKIILKDMIYHTFS